jgi:pyruvate,water dikinase
MARDWISWFEDLSQDGNNLVGKKSANLGEMTRMGLRVPPGFALTLDAYKDFMSLTGADKEIKKYLDSLDHDFENIQHFNDVGARLRDIVETREFPPEMKDELLSQYRELCSRCRTETLAVSVRSAGAASHPGQYETYLNVIGESDFLDKIKKVWSSTFNPRSLSARKRAGAPLETDPVGVAVVKMVNARAAGVLFTADPNTGDTTRMIIEANWGLGESVVGGEAMPDVYILEKEGLNLIEKKMGSKGKMITFKDVGVVEEDTPADKCETLCLSDEEVKEIGRLGLELEKHFGVPQDTEWAVDNDLACPESVVLLQTRPEIIAEQKKPVDQILDLMMSRLR